MKKLLIALALLVTILGLAAVCAAGTLEQAKKDGFITIAVTAGSPPFSFVNADNGQDAGFDVDYADEVAKRLGIKAKILMVEWAGILPGLLAGKYDMIIGSMAITEPRKEQADFSMPYYVSGAQIIVRKDEQAIQGFATLENKKVGVTLGTTYEEKAREVPGVTVVTYKTEVDQLMDLVNKNIDAVITDKYIGAYIIKDSNLPLKLAGDLIYNEELGIALRKDDADLLKEVDKAVEEITKDGTFEKLASTWFGI